MASDKMNELKDDMGIGGIPFGNNGRMIVRPKHLSEPYRTALRIGLAAMEGLAANKPLRELVALLWRMSHHSIPVGPNGMHRNLAWDDIEKAMSAAYAAGLAAAQKPMGWKIKITQTNRGRWRWDVLLFNNPTGENILAGGDGFQDTWDSLDDLRANIAPLVAALNAEVVVVPAEGEQL